MLTYLKMNFKINWDTLGIATSLACAIHCALLPLIFTSLPVFGINVIENIAFEIFMVVLAFAIGIYSLYHGYKKHHHNLLPIIIFTAGIVSLVLKLFFVEYENWLLIPAITGIVTAHLINYRLCRIHDHAHADDCAH
ncbi:MAG: MerC domain-containing protein [Segetibacter sp.]